MRKFYLTYAQVFKEKFQTLSGIYEESGHQTLSEELSVARITETLSAQLPLSWSHYLFLMGISDTAERRFYEIESCQRVRTFMRQNIKPIFRIKKL